uniref:ribonuclease H n=1 Tax=viral metagenome TaxID=1070528 RepID=A0A6C0DRI2_9ZZZZ
MSYYAVAIGRNIGIFLSWPECNDSVKGYKGAIYKKFKTKLEAEEFIEKNKQNNIMDAAVSRGLVEPTIPIPIPIRIPDYYVYTDGACSNNGRENAKAGIGIFFAMDDPRNVSKALLGRQTNNSAELTAIITTYSIIEEDVIAGKIIGIVTDSEYAIKCVKTYGEKCSHNGWEKNIPNRELVRTIYELYKNKSNIEFIHIQAHTKKNDVHSIGNFYADKLANEAIGLSDCPYNK